MADFGSRNMGFFGGTSSGGGGGTSTGVNGLNGTTNIGLGGTLTGNTYIFGGGFDFVITQASNLVFEASNVLGNANIGNYGNYIRLTTFNNGGNTSTFYVEDSKIYTIAYSNGNVGGIGLQLDFNNSNFTLGDYDDINNKTKIIVDDKNNTMQTFGINGQGGLDFNFSTEKYILGATNSKVTCDNSNTELTLSCSSIILSNTPSITSATITTTATPLVPSDYITIFINGAERKIQLFNP